MVTETAIKRKGKHENMAALNVWIPYSLSSELDLVREFIGKTKGDAVAEALRYWLNAQTEMGVRSAEIQCEGVYDGS